MFDSCSNSICGYKTAQRNITSDQSRNVTVFCSLRNYIERSHDFFFEHTTENYNYPQTPIWSVMWCVDTTLGASTQLTV